MHTENDGIIYLCTLLGPGKVFKLETSLTIEGRRKKGRGGEKQTQKNLLQEKIHQK